MPYLVRNTRARVCSRSLPRIKISLGASQGESPTEGNCTVERGLAALLDATVQDRVVGQAASAIEGEGSRNISR